MFRLSQTCFLLLLLHCVSTNVFLHSDDASQVLNRRRRANSPFEEWRQGDMERECVEERCDKEEAREIFEHDERTDEFWNKYYDGDACVSNPCVHGGVCKDSIGKYTCFCPAGFQGNNCEISIPELCENNNGGCEHFCTVKRGRVECSCADGYYLDSDDKKCLSDEPFKCGFLAVKNSRSIFIYQSNATTNVTNTTKQDNTVDRIANVTHPIESLANTNEQFNTVDGISNVTLIHHVKEEPIIPSVRIDTRIVNGQQCPPGECPWQAFLVDYEDRGFCGGTILSEYFILTAAHCMNQTSSFYVVLGEFDTEVREGREATHEVEQVFIHKHYMHETYHNDISLIKLATPITYTKYILPACLPERNFAEKVLMNQPDGLISGFGRLGESKQTSTILLRLTVPYINRATCMESSQYKISHRMFCAGYDTEKKDACQGDSGGPHVTRFGETWFSTGIVSWGEGCAREGKYGIYTQVSRYIQWIRDVMTRYSHTKKVQSERRRKRWTSHSTLWV